MTTTADAATELTIPQRLRQPFPAEVIGKLPLPGGAAW
jgi:hypothetical protein